MPDPISKRSARRLQLLKPSKWPSPTGPYYDPELHPEGTINLSTAENSLLTEQIIPLLREGEVAAQHIKYRDTLLRSARPQLATLLPAYANRHGPIRPITNENSVPGPGAGALLAQLTYAICDEGEGVLMTTVTAILTCRLQADGQPYYHDYVRDITYPAGVVPVFAAIPADVDPLSPDVIPFLKDRVESSGLEGVPIRCLILCNPHNPIPRCYPTETIQAYIELAQALGIHLIVDQIFANTVFKTRDNPEPEPFHDTLSFPAWAKDSRMLDYIHVLTGPTKDLGLSGIKAALLVTENALVRQLVRRALLATPISGLTDAALSRILADGPLVDQLLTENARKLGAAMDLCATWARHHKLPYVSASAGVYFILDLSPIVQNMSVKGDDAVIELMRRMIACRVHINPMALDLDPVRYRFRFIFTHKPDVLKLVVVVASLARGRGSLALGNVVGSTIANILGAFSLGLIFYKPSEINQATLFEKSSIIYSLALLLVTTLASALLAFGRHISWRAVGVVFIVLFGVYIASISYLIHKGIAAAPEEMSDSDSDSDTSDEDNDETRPLRGAQASAYGSTDGNSHPPPPAGLSARAQRFVPRGIAYHIGLLLAGFLAIVISGYVLSIAVANLVDEFGISDVLAGMVILSIATTIPEKFVAFLSGYKGHGDILLANTVGSNIFLLTLCLGVIWTGSDGTYRGGEIATSEVAVMLGSAALLAVAVVMQGRFARPLGWIMLLLYIAFIVLEFTVIHRV